MATQNITQLRRIVFRKYDVATSSWSVPLTFEPEDLGQDTVMTVNVAPRKTSRATSVGTTETPIPGTYDALAASITFMPSVWKQIFTVLNRWNAATYEGASSNAGQAIFGGDGNYCDGGDYYNVVAQGLCDDGSTADVEVARCMPSIDDDIEIGTGDAQEITLNLNPIIYNATLHSADGLPGYNVRFGDFSLTQKERLNAATGQYVPVTDGDDTPDDGEGE